MWSKSYFLLFVLYRKFALSFTHDSKLSYTFETKNSMMDSAIMNKIDGDHPSFHSFTSPFLTSSRDLEKYQQENALIVLNSKLTSPPSKIFKHLWASCALRICADGGANRLYEATKNAHDKEHYIPHLIIGDLDSLHDHVREYYSHQGCKIEQDDDQDCNDLDKALSAVQSLWNQKDLNAHNVDHQKNSNETATTSTTTTTTTSSSTSSRRRKIYVYGAFGGRFDQEMAGIHAMYRYASSDFQILLYNDETFAFLLTPSVKHEIRLRFHSQNIQDTTSFSENDSIMNVGEGPTVGLIPISCSCSSVTTSGLKWDLDGNTPLTFGGPVFSTSNRALEEVIYIECSEPLVFTAEIIQL